MQSTATMPVSGDPRNRLPFLIFTVDFDHQELMLIAIELDHTTCKLKEMAA